MAYYEVAIMPLAILVGLFPRWVRLLSPIIYAQFLLQRYNQSNTTKRAFRAVRLQMDKVLDAQATPEPIRKAYLWCRELLEKIGGGVRAAETPQGAPMPAGAAPAAASAPSGSAGKKE